MKKVLEFLVWVIVIVAFLCVVHRTEAQVVTNHPPDPAAYAIGFSRMYWAPALNCIVVAYGLDGGTDSSVRCFSPSINDWIRLFPNNGRQAPYPSSRDNEMSLYNDNVREFWVWFGTTGDRSGRFNLSACAPVPKQDCAQLAYSNADQSIDTVQNSFVGGSDSGVAWNPACDGGVGCGLVVGGNGGGIDSKVWIIERNTVAQIKALGGITTQKYCGDGDGIAPHLWIACEFTGSKPPPRNQALNTTVAVGNDFYVGAGTDPDNVTQLGDLWKFTRSSNTFSQVSMTWTYVGYQSSVTYDSDLNMIVVNGRRSDLTKFLIGWDLTNSVQVDMSAISDRCRDNQLSTYAPTVKKHFYLGGNICPPPESSVGPVLYSISPSGFYGGGRLYMAPGLWVTRPLSGMLPGMWGRDSNRDVKHMSWEFNPGNGRIYNFGGDWAADAGNPTAAPDPSGISGSGKNTVYSLDPVTGTGYFEYPFCGNAGEVTYDRPTELTVAWDSLRSKFWVPFGFYGAYGKPAECLGTWVQQPLTFDPATKKFTIASISTYPWAGQENPKHGFYDAATDSIWVGEYDGRGAYFAQYVIATDTWATHQIPCVNDPHNQIAFQSSCGAGQSYINNFTGMKFTTFAFDGAHKIYFIYWNKGAPGIGYQLIEFDMNTGGATVKARPPIINPRVVNLCINFSTECGGIDDTTKLNFDTADGKLFYNFLNGPQADNVNGNLTVGADLTGYPSLLVYDVATDSWTVDNMLTDRLGSGFVRGNVMSYNAALNYMISYGGCVADGCGSDPTWQYFYLYRWGNTAPQIPTSTITVNSANPNAAVTITVTGADNNGATSGQTPFQRTYTTANKTAVTLQAPATANGANFVDWTGPCASRATKVVANDICNAIATSNQTFTANYSSGATTFRLTITAPIAVDIAVSPEDNNHQTSCTTGSNCTFTYFAGQSVIATAPATVGQSCYTLWTGGTTISGLTTTTSMSSDRTLNVNYATGTTHDNAIEFSNVQGSCGWSYRDTSGAAMTFSGGQWGGGQSFLVITAGNVMHPGTSLGSVRRWTSPEARAVVISGTVHDGDVGGGDGVDVLIQKNGANLFVATIANGDIVGQTYSINTTVAVGDTIDWIVMPRSNNSFDTTFFSGTITPASVAQISVGAGVKNGASVTFGQ